MGFLDSFKSWFKTEAAEAGELGRQTKGRLEAELDRRESELNATPAQRLEQLQEQIADGGSDFDELQAKIDGRGALADAAADVAGLGVENDPDLLDLDSEEVTPPEPPPAG